MQRPLLSIQCFLVDENHHPLSEQKAIDRKLSEFKANEEAGLNLFGGCPGEGDDTSAPKATKVPTGVLTELQHREVDGAKENDSCDGSVAGFGKMHDVREPEELEPTELLSVLG